MELPAIEQHLRISAAAHAEGDADAIGDGLKLLSASHDVVRLLSALRNDPKRLASAASRSYLHANGFLKIALLAGECFKLRLHLWMPSGSSLAQNNEDIHNHRWDFASHMLAGAYRYQEFAPAADGTPYFAYSYRSPKSGSFYPLQAHGTEHLQCIFDAIIQPRTSYTLRAEVLHRVIGCPDQLTATLVLQAAARRQSTEVFAMSDRGRFVAVPIERLSPVGLDHHLKAFARYLTDRS
jgi:hypothetical protein